MHSRVRSVRWCAVALVASFALFACATDDGGQVFPDAAISNEVDQPLHYGVDSDFVPDGTDWSSAVSWWTAEKTATSFGIHLCVAVGAAATITAVEPLKSVGDVDVLAPLVMTLNGENLFFISQAGYPPVPGEGDEIGLAETTPITAACGSRSPEQGLVVALRARGSTGGGWRGVAISYLVEGADYRLEVPTEMLMCGTSTEPCGP